MNDFIKQLSEKARKDIPAGITTDHWIDAYNQKFAELIINECTAACGSQADKKNIRKMFGLPIESNIKYKGVDPSTSINSQYDREFNIPSIK